MFTSYGTCCNESRHQAAKRTAEFLFAGFDAGSLLSPKSTIEADPNPMLRDVFMTPSAGPEVVWEQFGMSKVRSIKARGFQAASGSIAASGSTAATLVAVRLAPAQLVAAGLVAAEFVASHMARILDLASHVVVCRGAICGRAAPYG
jgi:hypothetical protein